MVSRKSQAKPPPSANLDVKPANKLRRQLLHIKRKRLKDSTRRAERYRIKKEEAKNPKLKQERLKRNVPLTIDRKRVWDDANSDVEDGLGLSVDVERIKKQTQEEQEEWNKPLEHSDDQDDSDDQDEVDSMLASSGDDDDDDDDDNDEGDNDNNNAKRSRRSRRSSLPSATERATSPTQSTKSTNLSLAPEALATKFPSLFPSETPPTPKILITTSLVSSHIRCYNPGATLSIKHAQYIRRTAHRYSHKFSLKEIATFAANRNYTAILVLQEDSKRPSGLDVIHLPKGPMFHFTISNWVDGKRIPGHGVGTEHWPELILNNFRTPLGILTGAIFRSLFPPQPDIEGRQVVTLHNQRDYIFVRRHRYIFREKRETEKSVIDADGKEMKGAEGIRAGLQELGPRFTLKLRRIDKGIQRASGQEWEWKAGMEKQRTKFQL
ncbi:Brix domain protein [Aspergillus parasiticus SU-1]|uniref:Brix domain protein n=1 Tax=Aspergillus parasiticus (strain ATCC 56775 / NRRL 5862 / SRRC 143 / SU-1) TaxID=1403190 RepID=A0A0F0I367_ASPPU|nr:Brix domain protein [Aspergillus parasiticus SU-1]